MNCFEINFDSFCDPDTDHPYLALSIRPLIGLSVGQFVSWMTVSKIFKKLQKIGLMDEICSDHSRITCF